MNGYLSGKKIVETLICTFHILMGTPGCFQLPSYWDHIFFLKAAVRFTNLFNLFIGVHFTDEPHYEKTGFLHM